MTPIILIPARMAASRLPGKPLADIEGTPMIVRVLKSALSAGLGPVAVAVADEEIALAVTGAGGRAVLTDPALPSGSDRILAALRQIDPHERHDVVIDLQGDMPFVPREILADSLDLLASQDSCDIATVVAAESGPADRSDPDVVKAVMAMREDGAHGRALWFTRSVLYGEGPVWRHVGVYAYRREALIAVAEAPPSPLESRERLEQLRALELGLSIWAVVAAAAPIAVDTPADLERARAFARATADPGP
ncbi:MAG: 3-deoxy-manno-octulosonate cytidylyltransferase [Caulobacteraceae bacterium]